MMFPFDPYGAERIAMEPDRYCVLRTTWRHRYRIHRMFGVGRLRSFVCAILKKNGTRL